MAYMHLEIIELFKMLTLPGKEELLKKLQEITDFERNAPQKSYLEEAWTEIQINIKALSYYEYVDAQIEIDIIWDTCEELMQSGKLKDEQWSLRERILSEIIEADFFEYYDVSDPMMDLMKALCLTPKENLLCADLIYRIGSNYMKEYGAKIYKEYGRPEKYYEFLENNLSAKTAPYMELIEYYKESNPDKAVKIGDLGLKRCMEDQTDLMIYLLQRTQQVGDNKKVAKLMKGAKLRKAVDYAKVQTQLAQLAPFQQGLDELTAPDSNIV